MARPKRKSRKPVIALFGRIGFERGYCKDCKSTSFIRDGCYVCCGAIAVKKKPSEYKRESETSQKRKIPGRKERERILESQGYACFYCGVDFNSIHTRNNEQILIKLTWDHKLPYVLFQNSDSENFVAACQVCNALKHDMIFQTLEDAQVYLALRRKQKGFDF